MLTIKSTYNFPVTINADGNVVLTGYNTVCLENNGQQDVVINGNYTIKPGCNKILGGRINGTVEQTLAITFTGAGTKALSLIEETITKI